MATVGVDCDITLQHPNVYSGDPCPFICKRSGGASPGIVTVQRQTYLTIDDSYTDIITIWTTILAAATLVAPDGSVYTISRADVHTYLEAYLAERSGITLVTPEGTFTDLYATLTHTTEYIGHDTDEIVLKLNNGAGDQYGPFQGSRFYNSVWDGPLTWATSYWR